MGLTTVQRYCTACDVCVRLSVTEVHWRIIANLVSNSDPTLSRIAAAGCWRCGRLAASSTVVSGRRRPAAKPRDVFVYMKDMEIFSSNFGRNALCRPKTVPRILHNGRRIKHVTEFA